MKPRLVTGVLLTLLLVGAGVLGLILSGSGNSSGLSGGGQSGQNNASSGRARGSESTLVVKAQALGQTFLYSAGTSGSILPSMLSPLKGVVVTIVREVPPDVSTRDRPRPLTLRTNVSGIAQIAEPPGNYSVLIAGQRFSVNTTLFFRTNVTTTIDLKLIPSFASVNSMQVVGQDSSSALEPTATIYADVGGKVNVTSGGDFELVGQVAMNSLAVAYVGALESVNVNATATGKYDSPSGSWVVLAPRGAYQTYPNSGVLLVQYAPKYTVSYSAD